MCCFVFVIVVRLIEEFPKSFREQLEIFSSHGVVVSPHGAGLTNALYMVPGSSIVEVFPYHFDHNLYRTVSVQTGMGYFPVYSFNGSDAWRAHKVCVSPFLRSFRHCAVSVCNDCVAYIFVVVLRSCTSRCIVKT